MSLYAKGKKEYLLNPKKGYSHLLYEIQRPSLPRVNSNINSNLAQEKERTVKKEMSLFG